MKETLGTLLLWWGELALDLEVSPSVLSAEGRRTSCLSLQVAGVEVEKEEWEGVSDAGRRELGKTKNTGCGYRVPSSTAGELLLMFPHMSIKDDERHTGVLEGPGEINPVCHLDV